MTAYKMKNWANAQYGPSEFPVSAILRRIAAAVEQ
jgi:hypothetical protein